jgi:hypothetical protein
MARKTSSESLTSMYYRKPQKTHGFLAMHQQNDARVALFLQLGDEPLPGSFQQPLPKQRLQRRQHEEVPNDFAGCNH